MALFRIDRCAPLWFLTGLAAMLCAAMVIAFYELQMDAIFDRSEMALSQITERQTVPVGMPVPVVAFVSASVDPLRNDLTELERALVEYYDENAQELEKGELWLLDSSGFYVYFMPLDTPMGKDETCESCSSALDGVRIAYVDVTFPVDLVRFTTGVVAVFTVFGLIVFFVAQLRVARSFDEDDERMKSFFANASHELKTPLMAIRGYAEGVKTGIVDAEKGCDVIDRETERMAVLVRDIMALARIDAEAVEPRMARYDIRDILYEAVEAVTPSASAKRVHLEIDASGPVVLRCDEDFIFSVFSNVLTNAVRHANSKVVIILVRDGEKVLCEVANDGEPISREDAAHAFDRFYKGERGSTGIGMALAQEYVRLHGGSLTVSVADGRTVFRIKLPRAIRQ